MWHGKVFVKREQVLETTEELGAVLEYVAGKLKDLAAAGEKRTDDDEEMKKCSRPPKNLVQCLTMALQYNLKLGACGGR